MQASRLTNEYEYMSIRALQNLPHPLLYSCPPPYPGLPPRPSVFSHYTHARFQPWSRIEPHRLEPIVWSACRGMQNQVCQRQAGEAVFAYL